MLRLHDTATGTLQELDLRDPGRVSMYVCGSTVYADPHIGHGRFALVWDIIRRYLAWTGLEVNFVSNVTDIDDKIIDKANALGCSAADVAKTYEDKWWESMDRLGVGRPTSEPHATSYVEQMVALIGDLVDAGKAYPAGDGVYFSVDTVADYGLLAHQAIESLRVGARVAVDSEQGKRSPIDFALWKFAKPGEPWWPSPWGPGRPGWHTECVVMALDLLGDDFDLHGGGLDLAFPHHENERAQAVAAGRRFSRRWAHSGMVVAEGGEKMSKSLGNVISLPELLSSYDPRAYRLLVLQSHYRSPVTVSDTTLKAAAQGMERLNSMARRFPRSETLVEPDPSALERFREYMDNDLGTVQATGDMFDLVRRANSMGDQGRADVADRLAAAVFEMCRAVGLELDRYVSSSDSGTGTETITIVTTSSDPGSGTEAASIVPTAPAADGLAPGGVGSSVSAAQALARARDEARGRGDYAEADALRQRLQSEGWIVEDTPGGTVIRR